MLKVVDFERLDSNRIKFYFSDRDNITDVNGDDWNDKPYNLNAGLVYEEFIDKVYTLPINPQAIILEPCDVVGNNVDISKKDLLNGTIPCLLVIPPKVFGRSQIKEFDFWLNSTDSVKIYLGDTLRTIQNKLKDVNSNVFTDNH